MRWAVIVLVLLAFVLVPFFLFEDWFNALSATVAEGQASGWAVALGIGALLASDVVLPIPSSLVSTAAGVTLGFWTGTLVVWVGMTLSCAAGYAIGATSAALARRFAGEASVARAADLASRFGDLALVLCRPVPVLAEASVIAAGLVKTPPLRVLGYTTAANLGIAAGYSAIGAFSMRVDSFVLAFLGAMVIPGLAMLAGRRWLTPAPRRH